MDYHLLACSGAQTENLLPAATDPTTGQPYRNDWASRPGRNVRYADPANDFAGQAVCGDPETVHGIVSTKAGGEDPEALISQQSFHPKISGTANYAAAFNRTLRNWGL